MTHEVEEDYWSNGTEAAWLQEMGGMADMLQRWANVPAEGMASNTDMQMLTGLQSILY